MKQTMIGLMQVHLDHPDKGHTLDEAFEKMPVWKSVWINRHENGWLFVGSGGMFYSLDNGIEGWLPEIDAPDYQEKRRGLGDRISRVYVEEVR